MGTEGLVVGLSNVSLACGARQNAAVIVDELEMDPITDAPAPAGPTQTLLSRRPRAAAAHIRARGAERVEPRDPKATAVGGSRRCGRVVRAPVNDAHRGRPRRATHLRRACT